MNKESEEIDLFELISKIFNPFKKFFAAIISAIIYLIKITLRKWYIIILSVIIGGVIGYVKNELRTDLYVTKAILKVNTVDIADAVSQLQNLNTLIEESSYDILAEQLNLKPEEVSNIYSINISYIYDINNDDLPDITDELGEYLSIRDTTIVRYTDRLGLSVQMQSMQSIKTIENAIVDYVNNNPYFVKEKQVNTQQLKSKIAFLDSEINKLKELQNIRYKQSDYKIDDDKYILKQNEKLYHNDILNLFEQKQRLEKQLALNSNIAEYSKNFSRYTTPKNFLTKMVARYSLILFVLSLLTLIFIDKRNVIKEFINN
ncbi:MAG: hypothetical protein N4A72_19945 [Bacteroidales bacterium]|jgi:hypothetical protein|nr:hypothetical protein [Bacteroidales bacterium]